MCKSAQALVDVALCHQNLQSRPSPVDGLDLDDIKTYITFPQFDGRDELSSLNIFLFKN